MSTKNRKNSRNDRIAADQSLIDGSNKNASKLPPSFSIDSKTTSPPDMVKLLEQRITTAKAVVAADAARAAAVKADKDMRAQTRKQILGYKRMLLVMYESSPDVLGDFGLKATTPTPPKVETKAAAAAKARTTRQVVGTLGSQQKKAKKAAASTAQSTTPSQTAGQPAPQQPAAPAPAAAPPAVAKSPS